MDETNTVTSSGHTPDPLPVERVFIKELGAGDQFRIMWGWCWRGLCVSAAVLAASVVAGGLFGFIAGIILALAGVDVDSVRLYLQILGGAVGMVIGFMSFLPLIQWITSSTFGGYQVWIVTAAEQGSKHQ